jgi:hypothetical protein
MSTTYTGVIIMILSTIAIRLHLSISDQEIQTTVTTIATIIGALIAFYGRYKKGDITWYGARKQV